MSNELTVYQEVEVVEAEIVDAEESSMQLSGFDYQAAIEDRDTRILVQQCANRIKGRLVLTAKMIGEIGEELLKVKEVLPHGLFGQWLEAEFEWDERHARRFMGVAQVFQIGQLSDLAIAPSALYLLASPSTPEDARQKALEMAQQGQKVTYAEAKKLLKKADKAVHYSTGEEEWNTPKEYVERVVRVLDGVDLDPCSNSKDEPNIPAIQHFTKEDDGLSKCWYGKVYMNPPYGKSILDWVLRLTAQFEEGYTDEAIALLPARTDTEWFGLLRSYVRCFIRGRLHFNESESGAPFPSVFFYLGPDPAKFIEEFSAVGDCYYLTIPSDFREDADADEN